MILRLLITITLVPFLTTQAQQSEQQSAPSGKWTILSSSGEPMERHENAYAKIDNKFYLIGGRGERPVEIYDPANNSWSKGATPPLSMHHFQAVSHNGRIYVMGAFTGGFPDEKPIPNIYIYDPDTDTWTKGAKIPEDRRRGAAGAVVYNDKIYLIGGIRNGHIDGHVRWLDAFDPQTGEWQKLPDAPRQRDHFQAAIVDGKLYAVAGRRTSYATKQSFELTIPEVDVYDFSTGKWSILPPSGNLPTERAGTTAITVGDKLIVIGGESGSQEAAHSEAEIYNPDTGKWEALAPLNVGRHGTQAIVYEGRVYIAAGSRTRGATEINSQEVFNIPDKLLE